MRPSLRVGLFLQALPSAPLIVTCGISALSASKGFMNTSAIHESLTASRIEAICAGRDRFET